MLPYSFRVLGSIRLSGYCVCVVFVQFPLTTQYMQIALFGYAILSLGVNDRWLALRPAEDTAKNNQEKWVVYLTQHVGLTIILLTQCVWLTIYVCYGPLYLCQTLVQLQVIYGNTKENN